MSHGVETRKHSERPLEPPAFGRGFFLSAEKPMESVINEIEFDFDQTVSIRTDVKLTKDDVKQIVSEAPEETLEEIVYQSLVTDELYLRARAKEVAAKLKQTDLGVKRIEYWDEEGNQGLRVALGHPLLWQRTHPGHISAAAL